MAAPPFEVELLPILPPPHIHWEGQLKREKWVRKVGEVGEVSVWRTGRFRGRNKQGGRRPGTGGSVVAHVPEGQFAEWTVE